MRAPAGNTLAGSSEGQGEFNAFEGTPGSGHICRGGGDKAGGDADIALFSVLLKSLPADVDRLGLLGAQLAIAVVILCPFFLCEFISGARPIWNAAALAAILYVGSLQLC